MSTLEATAVTKEFGGLIAVDNVNFEIGDGEIVGLIGPNGAGKTTLFNTITGLYEPEAGSDVRFGGRDILEMDTYEIAHSGILRTFQIVRVFGEMTVLENAMTGALFGSGRTLSKSEARERGTEALTFVGLAESANEEADALPIAQQKQLELARALAADPDLLMLDEIVSGLTPGEVDDLTDIIRRLRDERGVSVFWIEHIMDAIMGVVDRIIVLNDGRKIADATPAEIRENEEVIEAYLGEEA